MDITTIKIADLKPASYNPRRITDWEMRKLMRSIESFGFVEPVVVNSDMTIIGGHQRVEAAKNIGYESVPCVVVEISKGREKALNLALNRIGGEFDDELVALLLKTMEEEDRMLSGMDEKEIAEALDKEIEVSLGEEKEEKKCEMCGKKL